MPLFHKHTFIVGGCLLAATFSAGINLLTAMESLPLEWERLSPTPFRLEMSKVEWNGSCFIAVGSSGLIARSEDGTEWSVANSGVTEDLSDLAWIDGQWVVVGYQGVVFASLDGLEWTQRRFGSFAHANLSSLAANDDGRIVAVGHTHQTGHVITSDDGGLTWLDQSFDGPELFDVVWTGGGFYAAGGRPGNAPEQWGGIWFSADGLDWELRYSSAALLQGITWTGSRLVAVGRRFEPPSSQMVISVFLYSNDGIDWQISRENIQGHIPETVRWLGDACYAVGHSEYVSRSVDGINWTLHQAEPRLEPYYEVMRSFMRGVAGPPENRVGVGSLSLYRESGNGIWRNLIKGPVETFAMATAGVGTVAVSIADHHPLWGQATSRGRIYLSMDQGTTLEPVFHDSAISAGDIIYHQGVYWVPVAGGNVLFSSDGETWEAESTGGENQPYAMAAHDGTLVTAGALGEILYRNEQGLWSAPVRLNSGVFTAVTRGEDSWIVVGTVARTSYDGINWKAENLGTTRTMRGVAAIGEIAVAAGDNGTVSVRNLWGVWTLAPSLGFTSLRSVVAFQERFYIINDEGKLWSSLDGFFWEEEERIPVQRVRRLKVVGDRLVATSYFGEIIAVGRPSPAKTTLSYSEWIEAHADEFPPERRGESDVNGVLGIPNLLAYGLGVLPSSAQPTDLPLISRNDDSDLIFEYKRNRNATGIVYRALQSEDLSIWAEALFQDHSLMRAEDEHEVWQAIVPRSSNRRFFRLEVSNEEGT